MRSTALAGTRAASTACGACGHARIRHLHRAPHACGASEWLVVGHTDGGQRITKPFACTCRHYVEPEQ